MQNLKGSHVRIKTYSYPDHNMHKATMLTFGNENSLDRCCEITVWWPRWKVIYWPKFAKDEHCKVFGTGVRKQEKEKVT